MTDSNIYYCDFHITVTPAILFVPPSHEHTQTPFEIEGDTVCGDCHKGPMRGRMNVPAIPGPAPALTAAGQVDSDGGSGDSEHRPFTGLWLCPMGSLGLLSLADFMSLAVDGGASRVFEKPTEMAAACDVYMKSQIAASTDGGSARPRAIILTNHNSADFKIANCQGASEFFVIVCCYSTGLLDRHI